MRLRYPITFTTINFGAMNPGLANARKCKIWHKRSARQSKFYNLNVKFLWSSSNCYLQYINYKELHNQWTKLYQEDGTSLKRPKGKHFNSLQQTKPSLSTHQPFLPQEKKHRTCNNPIISISPFSCICKKIKFAKYKYENL